MKVIDLIKKEIPTLNNNQLSAIQSIDGPVLIIAGPGTGKTQTLILRALYILLTEKAKPEEIVLTTFTEKAAFELRDRISQLAKKMHYSGQLHKMKIGTIHGICNDYIGRYLSADIAEISKGYSILEGLSQQFFIYENLDDIAPPESDLYLNKWKSKWSAISNLCSYFNKMTEELVDPEKMLKSREEFHVMLGNAYNAYSRILMEQNKLDFSNIQKVFWNLLKNKKIYDRIRENTKFIMVDEYQDTNYIQEQIIYKLASPDNNLCVVGDEDQSLYRFRGATVRNILEFSSNFPKCIKINLSINYRSHENIIERNNKFMESIEWGKNRYEKRIEPIPKMKFPSYPSVFCIWGKNEKDEANKVVDLINYLKDNKVIDDYSDIALLLRSVQNHSSYYIDAFNKKGIKFFCPRAKKYFDNDEVKQIIACYVLLFLTDDERAEFDNEEEYLLNSLKLLNKSIERDLKNYIQNRRKQIEQLQSRGSKDNYALDLTLLDFFYIFLAFKPFSEHLNDKNRIHNLAGFSALLTIFQEYYKISVVTGSNKRAIKYRFFASFLRMLLIQGISEYEDPDEPLPKGYVQIMTIHQAKGLEFPVVITGSLNKRFSVNKMIDRDIGQYYRRKEFEDEGLITEYDRMRHFYVAFTRAQKLLVLTTHDKPQKHFSPIWDGLEQYPHIKKETLKAQKFQSRPQFIPKKSFSLSGVNAYEICPRQYQYYVEYSFSPSKTSHFLFGNLVHYTIEDIHNYVLAEKRNPDESQINAWFERNYGNLVMKGFRQLFQEQKERAFKQVMDYFNQNKDLMHRIKETEVEVSYEKEDYIVSGRIDLLISERDTFDILDFKTQPKSSVSKEYLDKCFNQLCLYSSILHKRDRININRMFIYWTSEELRQNALMEFKYNEKHLKEMDDYFDGVVQKIKKKDFCIREKPDPARVCKQCDLRFNCAKSRLIKFKPEELEEI